MTSAPRTELIRLRKLAGMSRRDLAREIGVGESYVYRVEVGARDPKFALMQKWIAALPGAAAGAFFPQQDAA